MKGDIYAMESKMNEFIKITEGEKVALIDPVGKVCLGVSKRFADNLDKTEFQEKLFPVWKQQTEFIKEMENNHEKINTVYLMVTRKCNMNCDFVRSVQTTSFVQKKNLSWRIYRIRWFRSFRKINHIK